MRIIVLIALVCSLPTLAMHQPTEDLITAVRSSDFDGVQHALTQNADVHTSMDPWRGTPLIFAVIREDLPITELLIAYGADINIRDNDGDTAFHRAMRCRISLNTVEWLLDHGADPHIKNNRDQTVHQMAEACDRDVRDLIREKEKSRWRLAKIAVPEATPSESASRTD